MKDKVPSRRAVLSMDIEDWYHLDYFKRSECDLSHSLLDGIEVYAEILKRQGVVSSFFVLGELAEKLRNKLCALAQEGHDLGSHGWNHVRPLTLSTSQCLEDFRRSKEHLETVLGRKVSGYRAPCFSLDRERLDAVQAAGYSYDSSRIEFGSHPLYGTLDMNGFDQVAPCLYRRDGFCEFEVSTVKVLGRHLPVSGGGYLRIFPWLLMRWLLNKYARQADFYVLYIHPFELSTRPLPPVPASTRPLTEFRFRYGRNGLAKRLEALIQLLRYQGFQFTTFKTLREEMVLK